MKTALIAGATGLIGSQLLQLLVESPRYKSVIAVTRHDLPVHPKLTQIKIAFDSVGEKSSSMKADDVFCCLGTTMAKAGSKENFYQVDFYYPLLLAKISRAEGAKQFLLISALGADAKSSIYYNHVKGEIEEAVKEVDFESIHIFRPSLLLGPRKERRFGEDVGKFLSKYLGFLVPEKYKPIESIRIARAMFTLASRDENGVHIHDSKSLQQY